jgi:hypothetical protein
MSTVHKTFMSDLGAWLIMNNIIDIKISVFFFILYNLLSCFDDRFLNDSVTIK